MAIIVPDYVFRDVTRITLDFLLEKGVKALILDVDNTLTEHDSQELRPEISAWLGLMRESGIHLGIASNNYEKRVAPFAKKIGVDHVSFCCKPLPFGLAKLRKKWNVPREAIVLVGDQIFTDRLAGTFYGIKVFLVKPLSNDPSATVRFKRRLEKPILLKYYKRGGKLL